MSLTERVAVIGDVHGDARRLRRLIDRLRTRYGDLGLYAVGDLNDRGPDTKGVIQTCIDEKIRAVVGNHDAWMREMLSTGKFSALLLSRMWGARPVLESYGCTETEPASIATSMLELMPDEHKAYIREMPFHRRLTVGDEDVWITHSGIERSWVDGLNQRDEVLGVLQGLSRERPQLLYFGYPELCDEELWSPSRGVQVFGHQAVSHPIVTRGWAAIDTGCGDGNALSAFVFPEREIMASETPGV